MTPIRRTVLGGGALLARPALHIFEDGSHGFGTRLSADRSAMTWPALFASFARCHGVLN